MMWCFCRSSKKSGYQSNPPLTQQSTKAPRRRLKKLCYKLRRKRWSLDSNIPWIFITSPSFRRYRNREDSVTTITINSEESKDSFAISQPPQTPLKAAANADHESASLKPKEQLEPLLLSSYSGALFICRKTEDLLVTPFAQILVSLRQIRTNMLIINEFAATDSNSDADTHAKDVEYDGTNASIGKPSPSHKLLEEGEEDKEEVSPEADTCMKIFSRKLKECLQYFRVAKPNSPIQKIKINSDLSSFEKPFEDRRIQLCREVLEEVEWCLEQLEDLRPNQSVGNMATDKFKKMIDQKLHESLCGSDEISQYILYTFMDRKNGKETTTNESISPTLMTFKLTPKDMVEDCYSYTLCPKVITKNYKKVEQFLDKDLNNWGLNIFELHELSENRSLTVITYAILKKRNILETFGIPNQTAINYFNSIEKKYHHDVPYHNSCHAADVTQSAYVLLNATALDGKFTDLEYFAVIFAAAVHDVAHPGMTNMYLINKSHKLAVMYNDISVLENHHLATAFRTLSEENLNILSGLSKTQIALFRKMVIDMVLATDMANHMTLLAELKTTVESQKISGSGPRLEMYGDKIEILKNLLHCADLSNPTKPIELYRGWVTKILDEFFLQGDCEKLEGMEVSPMCDRDTVSAEKTQVSFIDFIVYPLWETWADLVYPDAQSMLSYLDSNREYFADLLNDISGRE